MITRIAHNRSDPIGVKIKLRLVRAFRVTKCSTINHGPNTVSCLPIFAVELRAWLYAKKNSENKPTKKGLQRTTIWPTKLCFLRFCCFACAHLHFFPDRLTFSDTTLKSFSVTAKKRRKRQTWNKTLTVFCWCFFVMFFFLPILAKHVKSYETFWEISLSQVQAF